MSGVTDLRGYAATLSLYAGEGERKIAKIALQAFEDAEKYRKDADGLMPCADPQCEGVGMLTQSSDGEWHVVQCMQCGADSGDWETPQAAIDEWNGNRYIPLAVQEIIKLDEENES